MLLAMPPLRRVWTRASFALYAENLTLDDISDSLHLTPDGGGIIKPEIASAYFTTCLPVCNWVLRSNCDEADDVDVHLASLLERLKPAKSGLRKLTDLGAGAEFNACILGDDFSVCARVSMDTTRCIAEVPAALRLFFTGERKFLAHCAGLAFGVEAGAYV